MTVFACVFRRFVTVSDETKFMEFRKHSVFLTITSKDQSPSWEANRFSASQGIPRIVWKPKFYSRIHKRPPPVANYICNTGHYHQDYYILVKLSLYLIKQHVKRSNGWLDVHRRAHLIAKLDRSPSSVSRPGLFIPEGRAPGKRWSRVGPRTALDESWKM